MVIDMSFYGTDLARLELNSYLGEWPPFTSLIYVP